MEIQRHYVMVKHRTFIGMLFIADHVLLFHRRRSSFVPFLLLLSLALHTPFLLFFSLKMEAEKLAQEKTEIQRQYIMVRFPFSTLPLK